MAIAHEIDSRVQDRRFWLFLDVEDIVDADKRDHPDLYAALAWEIDLWLGTLDPTRKLDPDKMTVELGSLSISVHAGAKGDRAREWGGTIVGNPAPAIAYWTGP
jgi:hypothetical protein